MTTPDITECENYVVCSTKTGDEKRECRRNCDIIRRGFDTIPYLASDRNTDDMNDISNELNHNLVNRLLIGKEVNGKNNEYGKAYFKVMDTEISLPLTRKTVNANCTINGKKHRQYMKINAITDDNNLKNIHINIPHDPVQDKKGWVAIFDNKTSGHTKAEIGSFLIKLKNECPNFLYDQRVNSTDGTWDPQHKLTIPPNCSDKLKKIIGSGDQGKLLFEHLKKKGHIGGLRGLIPATISAFQDIAKVALNFDKFMDYFQGDNECKEIQGHLGELKYDAKNNRDGLKLYKAYGIDPLDIVDEFQNYNDTSLLSIIVLSILIVILFILKSIL
jgi:hypothetical protein